MGNETFYWDGLISTLRRFNGANKKKSVKYTLRLLKTNPSKATFEENITQFKRRLRDRGYPDNLIVNTLSEIKFSERMPALQISKKHAGEFCRLLQNIAHLCLILITFL